MRAVNMSGYLLAVMLLMAQAPLPASIGVAAMTNDGTIILRLRAEGAGGMVGEGNLTYKRGNPQYEEVLHHIGGLKPGETKAVPPWKD
ncbi:MAG: hypothetical protein V4527_10630 [Pseudomonadota bacterium]